MEVCMELPENVTGIVADSVPANEFQECINKAKAVTTALTMSAFHAHAQYI